MFEIFDKNHDGRISKQELIDSFGQVDNQIDDIIQEVDANGDKMIS